MSLNQRQREKRRSDPGRQREGVERPESAEPRRALWERHGVVPDDLAAQVLVLNLPAVGDGLVDHMARLAAADGVPLRLTLHRLNLAQPTLADAPIYICKTLLFCA